MFDRIFELSVWAEGFSHSNTDLILAYFVTILLSHLLVMLIC
jgi:hypothetical protein